MQSSSEQPLVGEERYVTTRIKAAKETTSKATRRLRYPNNKAFLPQPALASALFYF